MPSCTLFTCIHTPIRSYTSTWLYSHSHTYSHSLIHTLSCFFHSHAYTLSSTHTFTHNNFCTHIHSHLHTHSLHIKHSCFNTFIFNNMLRVTHTPNSMLSQMSCPACSFSCMFSHRASLIPGSVVGACRRTTEEAPSQNQPLWASYPPLDIREDRNLRIDLGLKTGFYKVSFRLCLLSLLII